MPKNTFVHAALKEQRKLKLPWFKNIQPLLKLDEIYHLDHVSAHRIINESRSNKLHTDKIASNRFCTVDFSNLTKAKPLPSEKFRVQNIFNILTDHFVQCWEHEKSNSSKLSFYHTHKSKFARETYLDEIRGFSRRYSMTQIRISSHNLEIERGRYTETPKELRICNWCNISMGEKLIEDEKHFLFVCDLYADLRAKLIKRLNSKLTTINNDQTVAINCLNPDNIALTTNFMTLLSPYTVTKLKDVPQNIYNTHHKLLSNYNRKNTYPEIESIIYQRSYILNCLCTYTYHALNKRQTYLSNLRELENKHNTFVINFT